MAVSTAGNLLRSLLHVRDEGRLGGDGAAGLDGGLGARGEAVVLATANIVLCGV